MPLKYLTLHPRDYEGVFLPLPPPSRCILLHWNTLLLLLRRYSVGRFYSVSVPEPAGWCVCSLLGVRIGSFFNHIPRGGTFTATARDYC